MNVFYKCWWPCGKHCCDDQELLNAIEPESKPLKTKPEPAPESQTMDEPEPEERPPRPNPIKSVPTRSYRFVDEDEAERTTPNQTTYEQFMGQFQ